MPSAARYATYALTGAFFYASHFAAKRFIEVECESSFVRAVINKSSPHCVAARRYKNWLEDVTNAFLSALLGAVASAAGGS
jgi:hypothetical protein